MLSQQFNQIIYDYRAFFFLAICLLAQIIGWRLWRRWLRPGGLARSVVNIAFIVFNFGWALTLGSLYWSFLPADFFWTWPGRASVAWQLVYLLMVLVGSVVSVGVTLLGWFSRKSPRTDGGMLTTSPSDQGRRKFLKTMGLGGTVVMLGLSGYGVVRQGLPPRVERALLFLPDLPPSLEGFTIAQISDIHLGLWSGPKELDLALAVVAEEKPHLVVFTGDLVDRDPQYAWLYREPLKRLAQVPHGLWGILGNHDHYTEPRRITEIMNVLGLQMLVDQQVNLPGLPLSLIGLDDQGVHQSWLGSGRPSLGPGDTEVLDFGLVSGAPARPGDVVVLLNHRPEGLAQAAGQGCHLYLAGHTHGGQYQCPGLDQVNLAAAFYKYSSGFYKYNGCALNVSRGLAAVGMPFRLWAWPEINIITLKRGSG